MFCRSCLELRYGQDLDQAKAQERAGEWLCPHCYEDDHPDDVSVLAAPLLLPPPSYPPAASLGTCFSPAAASACPCSSSARHC